MIFITLNASASRGDLGGSGNVDTKIEVNKALLIVDQVQLQDCQLLKQ
jgi:hypothetical protein